MSAESITIGTPRLSTSCPPFIFVKYKWIYWRQDGDVSDDVTTTKAIRRGNDKMF